MSVNVTKTVGSLSASTAATTSSPTEFDFDSESGRTFESWFKKYENSIVPTGTTGAQLWSKASQKRILQRQPQELAQASIRQRTQTGAVTVTFRTKSASRRKFVTQPATLYRRSEPFGLQSKVYADRSTTIRKVKSRDSTTVTYRPDADSRIWEYSPRLTHGRILRQARPTTRITRTATSRDPTSDSRLRILFSRRNYKLPLNNVVFTEEDIRQLLHKRNPFSASGPDKVHPRILKETSLTLAKHFYLVFRQPHDEGNLLSA
ncbi:hypothetical protein CLF_102386 [Clonorchis sinensis]|uniref:Uncharacterized protein n=1 Tax=Clonorchis sinensis TaxID=79923 RepID=G7Y7T5_CLOSI|nr:hypothetical protein CLF_102386 [Clonorchis sinensis]